jgi:tetratricopeptide (TPR) repeat protein
VAQVFEPTNFTLEFALRDSNGVASNANIIDIKRRFLEMPVTGHHRSGRIARFTLVALLGVGVGPSQERWIDAFRAGRYADALIISEQDLKDQPSDAKLWTERAMALDRLGRNADSINSFQRALAFDPAFTPALEGAAELAYRIRDPRAQTFIAKLLVTNPQNTTAHAMAGVLDFESRNFKDAAEHFERAGPTLMKNEQAYSLYGACLLELGNAQQALPIFAALSERFPQSANVRYNLGYAQLLAGHAAEAITTLRPMTTGENPDASALNLMASAEAANGQLAAALNDLRSAARLRPEAEENYLDLATLCLEHNSIDVAEEIVNIGLQNVPNSARLYSMRGIINAQKNNYDQSSSDFEQANRLSPDKSYGSVGLSMVYAESKRPEEAIRILRDKLRTSPNDPTLNYPLADLLVNQPNGNNKDDLAAAHTALLRSIAAKPTFSNAHTLLGKVYRRTGDNAKAIEELKLALSYDSQNRVALNQIVSLLRETGRQQEAATYSASLRRILQQELKADAEQSRVRIVRVQ